MFTGQGIVAKAGKRSLRRPRIGHSFGILGRSASSTPSADTEDAAFSAELSSDAATTQNKALAVVIRNGMGDLNQAALEIQSSKRTRQSIFDDDSTLFAGAQQPSARQQSEQHRLMQVIEECLDDLSLKPSDESELGLNGEPMVILDVQVKPSLQSAHIYWTLPWSVLLDESIPWVHKEFYAYQLEQRILQGGGQGLLQRRVSAVLHMYKPPKLHLKQATQEMLYKTLKEMDME